MAFIDIVLKVLANVNIDSNTNCHIYQGDIDPVIGYGRVQIDGERYHTHRLSAAIHLNLDLNDPKQFACHKCSNRACCNPEHLYVGDNKSNQLDTVNNMCPRGHSLTGYNVVKRRRLNGKFYRNCRICKNEQDREAKSKLRRKVKG